jgi:hypothetical protein
MKDLNMAIEKTVKQDLTGKGTNTIKGGGEDCGPIRTLPNIPKKNPPLDPRTPQDTSKEISKVTSKKQVK